MEEDKWIRTEVKEIIIYIAIGLLLFVILPLIGGLFLRGFEESFTGEAYNISTYLGAFIIYFFMMIGALGVIIFPIARIIAIPRGTHPANQKNPNWFTIFTVSLIHSPEENGLLYRLFDSIGLKGKSNLMRWSLSLFRCFILSILIFGIYGILTVQFPQISVSDVPNTLQQLSPASDIIFGAGVPSFAENGVLMLIFFLGLGFIAYLSSRFKLGVPGFFILAVFLCFGMGFIWMLMHSIIYSNSEQALISTYIFGTGGALLTLFFASFIFFLLWHFMNNFFIKLSSYITVKEDLFFIAIIIWVVILVTYIFGEIYLYKHKKSKQEKIIIPQ